MMKLPFAGRIFWTVLLIVYVLVVVAWALIVRFSDYQMKPADYGGSFLSATILAYLVHLWILPGDYSHYDEDELAEPEEHAGDTAEVPPAGERRAQDE